MSRRHVVRDGDCIESLSFAEGLFSESVWNHPENAGLRDLRASPNVLQPGDVVYLPDTREKVLSVETGKRHIYRRRGVPARLRVRLVADDQPRAGVPYELTVEGNRFSGETDADGWIDHWIKPNAQQGTLTIDGIETFDLALGCLHPTSADDGLLARLVNLGYAGAGDSDPAARREAIAGFQRDAQLTITGDLDEVTRARVAALYRI